MLGNFYKCGDLSRLFFVWLLEVFFKKLLPAVQKIDHLFGSHVLVL